MRDHAPIKLTDFRGLYSRGEEEAVPPGFFISSQNNRFINRGVKTREGSAQDIVITAVRRAQIYKRIGEAQRLLILDSSGHLFDSTALGSPILTIAAMTDFSSVTLFNRAYITPHNSVTGLSGESIYVYDGSGVARLAAGAAPTGFTLGLADSTVSGTIDQGIHLVGVAFETASGYITAPGGFNQITNVGDRKLNVSSLPIGPTGTVARVLVSTRRLLSFNGDFVHQIYYFIPNGRIGNNSDTSSNDTIDYYDADLEEDASYLLDQLATIPAGVGIGEYNAKMIVWGEDAHNCIVRVSFSGEPESIAATDGFITVNPGDNSAGIKNSFGFDPLLIVQKSNRTYWTQDNGDVAATWPVKGLDDAIGTEPHGVAQILDYGHKLQGIVITAHKTGLRVFNGNFSAIPLTFNINDIWARITKTAVNTIEVVVDANGYELYAAIPLDGATSPSHILYGNFNEGLDAEKIKWDLWVFPRAPRTIVVDVDDTSKETVFKFGSLAGNIYKLNASQLSDFGTIIDSWIETALLPGDNDDSILHFTGARVRANGSGILGVSVRGLDGILTATGESLTLTGASGKGLFSGFNFTSERAAVKFRVSSSGNFYKLTRASIYVTPLWEQR